jgi:hypothetical protein
MQLESLIPGHRWVKHGRWAMVYHALHAAASTEETPVTVAEIGKSWEALPGRGSSELERWHQKPASFHWRTANSPVTEQLGEGGCCCWQLPGYTRSSASLRSHQRLRANTAKSELQLVFHLFSNTGWRPLGITILLTCSCCSWATVSMPQPHHCSRGSSPRVQALGQ